MADPSKTEKATGRRREEFRKKGSIAKSIEINTAIVLLVSYIYLKMAGGFMYDRLSRLLKFYLENIAKYSLGDKEMSDLFFQVSFEILILVIPFMLIILISMIVSNLFQVGFLITTEPIKPKLSKLNFINGFKNLFSKRSLGNLVKSIVKISIVGYIAYDTIRKDIPKIVDLFNMNVHQSFLILCQLAMDIIYKIVLAFIVIAILDYLFQRFTMEEEMKMSKQEIKEEHKRTEGDPLIKGEIRRRQMEMARHRMMSEVPKADVVVTNPFHIAVAIRYDAATMKAPRVVAKGIRKVAESIRDIANEHQVPIVENPPVARALYKTCKIDQDIPGDMYAAVADILTYIYRLSGKRFGIE